MSVIGDSVKKDQFTKLFFCFVAESGVPDQDAEGNVDHIAVVAMNFLFFVILFVFAVFET